MSKFIPNTNQDLHVLVFYYWKRDQDQPLPPEEASQEYQVTDCPIIGWVLDSEYIGDSSKTACPVFMDDYSGSNVKWALYDTKTGICTIPYDTEYDSKERFVEDTLEEFRKRYKN